jgi:hypothetical protein
VFICEEIHPKPSPKPDAPEQKFFA